MGQSVRKRQDVKQHIKKTLPKEALFAVEAYAIELADYQTEETKKIFSDSLSVLIASKEKKSK